MLRSMYSGISGMKVNQTKLDVTGNNIANVGTTAFKGSRVRFQDMLSQNMGEAIAPGKNLGGINPQQVGLGVQIAGIDTNMEQGTMQPTSRNLDAAVDGEGYFIVSRGSLPKDNTLGIAVDGSRHSITSGNGFEINYTRDGSFTLDTNGNLLNSDGYRIMGYAIQEEGNADNPLSIDYNKYGTCNFVDVDSEAGLKAGNVLVPLRIPSSVHVNASNIAVATPQNMTCTAGENTKITTAPTIDTNEKALVGSTDLKVEVKCPDGSNTFHMFVNGEDMGIPSTFYLDNKGNKTAAIPTGTDGIDFSTIKIGNPSIDSSVDATDYPKYSWSYTLSAEGDKKITSFSFEKDGQIKATLEDGKVTALGQIAMASFNNTAGLKKLGKNLYQNTANSGQAVVRSGVGADEAVDNSDGYGDIAQGSLEMSNVDLAEQFTDMIVASRAFQASGKMITTGDEILQDIINLKR